MATWQPQFFQFKNSYDVCSSSLGAYWLLKVFVNSSIILFDRQIQLISNQIQCFCIYYKRNLQYLFMYQSSPDYFDNLYGISFICFCIPQGCLTFFFLTRFILQLLILMIFCSEILFYIINCKKSLMGNQITIKGRQIVFINGTISLSFHGISLDDALTALEDTKIVNILKQNSHNITHLDLSFNSIGPIGTRKLMNFFFQNLINIKLSHNNIGEEGAYHLSLGLPENLSELYLSKNIGSGGLKHLENGKFKKLTHLVLGKNNISPDGAVYLTKSWCEKLTFLSLGQNNIGAKGIKILSRSSFKYLTFLGLSEARVGSEGVKHLVNGSFQSLTQLYLRDNRIGYEGAKLLSHSNFAQLTGLYLGNNSIGDEGVKSLAGVPFANLSILGLDNNCIHKQTVVQLNSFKIKNNKECLIIVKL